MADYISIAINAFFTGAGIIAANEIWDYFKKHKKNIHRVVTEQREQLERMQPKGLNSSITLQ